MISRDFGYASMFFSCWIRRLLIIEPIKSDMVFLSIAIGPIM